MSDTTQEVELNAKSGFVKVRGSDALTTLGIAIVVLVGYMVWEHKEDAKLTQSTFIMAVKEMTNAQKDSVQAQRVMNCLIALPQDRRENGIPTCERIAR